MLYVLIFEQQRLYVLIAHVLMSVAHQRVGVSLKQDLNLDFQEKSQKKLYLASRSAVLDPIHLLYTFKIRSTIIFIMSKNSSN